MAQDYCKRMYEQKNSVKIYSFYYNCENFAHANFGRPEVGLARSRAGSFRAVWARARPEPCQKRPEPVRAGPGTTLIEISYFASTNNFFFKKWSGQVLENFKGYSMQKISRNNVMNLGRLGMLDSELFLFRDHDFFIIVLLTLPLPSTVKRKNILKFHRKSYDWKDIT